MHLVMRMPGGEMHNTHITRQRAFTQFHKTFESDLFLLANKAATLCNDDQPGFLRLKLRSEVQGLHLIRPAHFHNVKFCQI